MHFIISVFVCKIKKKKKRSDRIEDREWGGRRGSFK
jgi:uncharacterized membrane protein